MRYKLIHQRHKCTGCVACVSVAGERWRMSKKDGKSILLNGIEKKGFYSVQIHPDEVPANRKAEQMCPVKIIQLIKIKEVK